GGARRARRARAQARADAGPKGYRRGAKARGGPRGAGGAAPARQARGRGGAPAPPGGAAVPRRPRRGGRTRREDPQPLSTALDGLLADQGWQMAAAVGSVFGRWDQLVGPDVAAPTRPERVSDGGLVVIAGSAAWA